MATRDRASVVLAFQKGQSVATENPIAGCPTRIDLGGVLDTKAEKLLAELKRREQEEYSQMHLANQRSFGNSSASAVHLGAGTAYAKAIRLVKDYLGSAPEK